MKQQLYLLLILMSSLFIYGCSTEPECFIADSIKELKVNQLNEGGYFLFLRTSGFGEKENFFELFRSKPEFNACGQTLTQAIFQTHVDDSEGYPISLDISGDEMEVIYSTNTKNNVDLESIKIEVH